MQIRFNLLDNLPQYPKVKDIDIKGRLCPHFKPVFM